MLLISHLLLDFLLCFVLYLLVSTFLHSIYQNASVDIIYMTFILFNFFLFFQLYWAYSVLTVEDQRTSLKRKRIVEERILQILKKKLCKSIFDMSWQLGNCFSNNCTIFRNKSRTDLSLLYIDCIIKSIRICEYFLEIMYNNNWYWCICWYFLTVWYNYSNSSVPSLLPPFHFHVAFNNFRFCFRKSNCFVFCFVINYTITDHICGISFAIHHALISHI